LIQDKVPGQVISLLFSSVQLPQGLLSRGARCRATQEVIKEWLFEQLERAFPYLCAVRPG
jgi:hypothetical protein